RQRRHDPQRGFRPYLSRIRRPAHPQGHPGPQLRAIAERQTSLGLAHLHVLSLLPLSGRSPGPAALRRPHRPLQTHLLPSPRPMGIVRLKKRPPRIEQPLFRPVLRRHSQETQSRPPPPPQKPQRPRPIRGRPAQLIGPFWDRLTPELFGSRRMLSVLHSFIEQSLEFRSHHHLKAWLVHLML